MPLSLKVTDHSRDLAGLRYVYPVLSRRAGGLSVGINFNVNNACNWRCLYCQVPNLSIGAAPPIDFELLTEELTKFLQGLKSGDFYQSFQVPEDNRMVKDIAISGNGEPTSVPEFARAVALIGRIGLDQAIFPKARFVLITNGSLIHQSKVQQGLCELHRFGGEVWFKLDSATESGRKLINNTGQCLQSSLENLDTSAKLCPTKIQMCLIDIDKRGFPGSEREALLETLAMIKANTPVNEVLLYTIARPSLQPEASRLATLSTETLYRFAKELESLGYGVSVST
jgi:wyosine [tRNA(Phe)-imidazoG37] synthetase (radical SAM superfamily)